MKDSFELPKFWFRKPDAWDTKIMEIFPYACSLSRDNLKHHYEIIIEVHQIFNEGDVTWRGPIFYFKNRALSNLSFALGFSSYCGEALFTYSLK